jgi:hypothetical protein
LADRDTKRVQAGRKFVCELIEIQRGWPRPDVFTVARQIKLNKLAWIPASQPIYDGCPVAALP